MGIATKPMAFVRFNGPLPMAPRLALANRHHFDALAQGRLVTRYCNQCQRYTFPPADRCQFCLATSTQWRDLPPEGVLYSKTRMNILPEAFHPYSPVSVGIIDIGDDVRLLAWLIDPDVSLDDAIELVTLQFDDGVLLGARAGQTAEP